VKSDNPLPVHSFNSFGITFDLLEPRYPPHKTHAPCKKGPKTWRVWLCRALVKGPTSTDTQRVFGCHCFQTSRTASAEGIKLRWVGSSGQHTDATGHRARGTSHRISHGFPKVRGRRSPCPLDATGRVYSARVPGTGIGIYLERGMRGRIFQRWFIGSKKI
jgi:hypothetical protein